VKQAGVNQGLDCMGLRSSMGTKNSSPAKGEQKRWGKVINNYIFSPSGLSEEQLRKQGGETSPD